MGARNYVGITGLVTESEVELALNEFEQAGYSKSSTHIPMLGFLVSKKTLNNLPTKNRRYPKFLGLQSLLKKVDNKALSMVHYNSREVDTLADQLKKVFDGPYQEGLCRAVQLNIPYPEIKQISIIKEYMPDLKIVFQASGTVIKEKTTEELVKSIILYGPSIDYVLIDPSGGRGEKFDIEKSLNLYKELSYAVPHLRIGFAGGLTGENVCERIKELRLSIGTSEFCIDAEGGLRDKFSEEYGDDELNLEKVRSYIKNSAKGFN